MKTLYLLTTSRSPKIALATSETAAIKLAKEYLKYYGDSAPAIHFYMGGIKLEAKNGMHVMLETFKANHNPWL